MRQVPALVPNTALLELLLAAQEARNVLANRQIRYTLAAGEPEKSLRLVLPIDEAAAGDLVTRLTAALDAVAPEEDDDEPPTTENPG